MLLTLLFALWLSGLIEQRLLRASSLNPSLQLVFSRLTKAALILVAVLIALPLVGIDLTTLSVFGGALGVGLGFGMQKIAANYVSGFIILLDRSISIGNMVSVGTDRGVVSQITTRYTVLRGLNGVEVLVPNETLVSSVVQNETFTDTRTLLPIDIQVSYGADLERAMAIMVEEAARCRGCSRIRLRKPISSILPTAASTCASACGSAIPVKVRWGGVGHQPRGMAALSRRGDRDSVPAAGGADPAAAPLCGRVPAGRP